MWQGGGGGQGAGRRPVVGPAARVGVTIEDIHATAGMRSTFGGYRRFAGHVPAADATVVARLKAAGAIVVGTTNGLCIWIWGTGRRVLAGQESLEHRADGRRILAGDTAGSIQCPAAFCGVFGMRPTEHRVPLTGTLFIGPIRKFRVLTTAGPMARSVADLRLALQVIGGPEGQDPEVRRCPGVRPVRPGWRGCGPLTYRITGRRWLGRSGPGPMPWPASSTSWA